MISNSKVGDIFRIGDIESGKEGTEGQAITSAVQYYNGTLIMRHEPIHQNQDS